MWTTVKVIRENVHVLSSYRNHVPILFDNLTLANIIYYFGKIIVIKKILGMQ